MNKSIKALLSEIKNNDLQNNVPSISPEVAKFLQALILEKKLNSGLEIGCAHGYSTIWIANALAQNKGVLTTLDHSKPSFEIAQKNIQKSKLQNVDIYFGAAEEKIITLHKIFDFIFIDGNKRSTLEFFNLCTQTLSKNGVIVIDDVLKFRYKMEDFWTFIQKNSEWSYEIHALDEDDGIMVVQKREHLV